MVKEYLATGSWGLPYDAVVSNLSEHGCFVAAVRFPKAGAAVALEFDDLEDPDEYGVGLKVLGTVTHVRSPDSAERGFGVRFNTVMPGDRLSEILEILNYKYGPLD